MQRRNIAAGLLASCLLAAGAESAELGFIHLAPGQPSVQVQVDNGVTQRIAYTALTAMATVEPGARQLRVTRADGSALVAGTLQVESNDRFLVIVAGNGSAAAPYQMRVSSDHNRPLFEGQSSLQEANLAIAPGANGNLASMQVGTSCSGGSSSSANEPFGRGTAPLERPYEEFTNVNLAPRGSCDVSARIVGLEGVVGSARFEAQPGDRLRRFVIGDGINAPYDVLVVNQGREPIATHVGFSPAIEGLWSIAGQPNAGLQVAYDPSAAAGLRVSAVYFGYDEDGASTWRTLASKGGERLAVLEYVGGNPDGTTAAVAFERGDVRLAVHSCREMTLIPEPLFLARPATSIFGRYPRDAVTLRRLFPPACPGSTLSGKGAVR